MELPYVFGGPLAQARLRAEQEDFRVEEDLGYEPTGAGEHVWLWLEKRGCNTDWVATQLAKAARVPKLAVGYAGLKDRHAVTLQWFSVTVKPEHEPDWATVMPEGVTLVRATRSAKKLKRGALKGNRFHIFVRDLARTELVDARLADIARYGVPNYFGEQRFGRDGENVTRFLASQAAGLPEDRFTRGILLSAARSHLFNRVLAQRVLDKTWDRPLAGDRMMLDGSRSVFAYDSNDSLIPERLAIMDIHPSGPLWGRGETLVTDEAQRLEQDIAASLGSLPTLLEQAGLERERRALRLPVRDLFCEWSEPGAALSFRLPRGTYATAVLRELVNWHADFDVDTASADR